MAASVTLFAKAFGDSRIQYLAELLGCDVDHALVRMARLWSVCAELQSDKPEVRHIRACLRNATAEVHLVESGLGDDHHRDPSLDPGVCRVRGCNETDWYLARLEQLGKIEAGKARAAIAQRDLTGRFLPNGPPLLDHEGSSTGPASLSPDLGSGSVPDLISDQPLLQASLDLERKRALAASESAGATPVARTRDELRRKLFTDAWAYAGLKHQELKRDGVDPGARNCWSGLPNASSLEAQNLFARIDELTKHATDVRAAFAQAGEIIRNRIDVAAAEARRPPKTLRWFIPARMWDAKSFSVAKDLTPEQAAQPRQPQLPHTRNDNEQPVRRIPTAR